MANIKSAEKRNRQSIKNRMRNRATKSQASTARKRLLEAIASNDKTASADRLKSYYSVLDKAVKRGIIKANTASRYKSRAARKVQA